MDALSIVIGVILLFVVFRAADLLQGGDYPYTRIEYLFTPAERSFLGVLNRAVGQDGAVFGKVRIADVLKPKKGLGKKRWRVSFNKISAKHFDYVVCHPRDLSIKCVIELNDSSHNRRDRKQRDAFVRSACKAAGLPLIEIQARRSYNQSEVRDLVIPMLTSSPT